MRFLRGIVLKNVEAVVGEKFVLYKGELREGRWQEDLYLFMLVIGRE